MSAERIRSSKVRFDAGQTYSRNDFIFRASALSLINQDSPTVATIFGLWAESAHQLPENALITFSEKGGVAYPVTDDGDFFTARAIS